MKKPKNIVGILAFSFVILFVVHSFISYYFDTREEYRSDFNFRIIKINLTDKRTMYFNETKTDDVFFSNYIFGENFDVKIGDSIAKKAYDKTLYVYRKDSTGVYRVNLKLEPINNYSFYDDPKFK